MFTVYYLLVAVTFVFIGAISAACFVYQINRLD